MDLLRALMRFFSYAYHGLLALFLFGISLLAVISNAHTLHLEVLPFKGATLTYTVLAASLVGLAAVLLAVKGTARVLLLMWSAVVTLAMIKGYVFSSYYFDKGEFGTTVALILGSVVALGGAWFQFRAEPASKAGQKVFSKAY